MTNDEYIKSMSKLISVMKPALQPSVDFQFQISNTLSSIRELFLLILEPLNDITSQLHSLSESIAEPLRILSDGLNDSIAQSLRSMFVQLAEISKLYDPDSLEPFSEATSDRFIGLSNSVVDDLISEPDMLCVEYSDSLEAFKSVTGKRRLSVKDIYQIVMLILTIWMLVRSYIPDERIDRIESSIQQTMEAANELIELKECELEIQSQQLEESKKQTQLLEQLTEVESLK